MTRSARFDIIWRQVLRESYRTWGGTATTRRQDAKSLHLKRRPTVIGSAPIRNRSLRRIVAQGPGGYVLGRKPR